MGWNKQVGDAWVLQRTSIGEPGKPGVKALQLQLLSPLLDIADAEALMRALAAEVVAAKAADGDFVSKLVVDQVERRDAQISYGSAVLEWWDMLEQRREQES